MAWYRFPALAFAAGSLVAAQNSSGNINGSVAAEHVDQSEYIPYPFRQHDDDELGSGTPPIVYLKYDFPNSYGTATDIQATHIWLDYPSASQRTGNGVYASTQIFFQNGQGGYMGTQSFHDWYKFWETSENHNFLFSVWDKGSAKVSWTTSGCSRFGGEGVGSKCTLNMNIQKNVEYHLKAEHAGSDSGGALWKGTVVDSSTGQTHEIGILRLPNTPGYTGYGSLLQQTDCFLEWWKSPECGAAPHGSVGIKGPCFNSCTVYPTQAYASYSSGTCMHTNAAGNIPGHGSGKPYAMFEGGGSSSRSSAENQALWGYSSEANETSAAQVVV